MTTTFGTKIRSRTRARAFIFFVVVACFVCCCCGSCAARRLARRNYPHGRELRRPLLDDTDAEVALGSSRERLALPRLPPREPSLAVVLRRLPLIEEGRAVAEGRVRKRGSEGRMGWRRGRSPPRLLSRTSFLVLPMTTRRRLVDTVAEASRAAAPLASSCGRRWYRVARRRQFTCIGRA